jgi:hypothetical protein
MTLRELLALIIHVAALSVAAASGAAEYLGAHPWWVVSAGLFGCLVGAAGLLALRLGGMKTLPLLWIAGGGLALSSAAALFGKRAFAASFAESALAGRFWYFGWIGVFASLVLLATGIVLHRLGR